MAAGPGLPRAPPSTWTVTRLIAGVRRREAARGPALATIADLAALVVLAARHAAPVGTLAAVDDDGHVRVVLVVGDHLVVELVRERLRDHAVDHRGGDLMRPRRRRAGHRPAPSRSSRASTRRARRAPGPWRPS